MDKKSFIALALIGLFIGFTIAQVTVRYWHPESVTVTNLALEEYLDGVLVENETAFEWGTLAAGDSYNWMYTVKNVGSTECTVYRYVYNLPDGWTYAWDGNETVLAASTQVEGNLTLTIPADASGPYNWYSYLVGE